ncbi:hypothetical protein COU57_00065 [Candidatus Pacearchaeota archaeon CG10_big_fil_rev_8_21_14_0_10_32_14]|nr:MAG: hypothetical protein COU57_00065 [Candidatus Pacearchaeota archaeon CG10_big_fil_rev_8_21_14_0_10_32_14]
MEEMVKLYIGIFILILGIPIGNFLGKFTKEELKNGQIWFKIIILVCMIGSIISLILWNDYLLFTFLFITIVASRSLRRKIKR